MFKKIFEYAGPYKKNMYVATVVVLVRDVYKRQGQYRPYSGVG